jgi:hypothetical protein
MPTREKQTANPAKENPDPAPKPDPLARILSLQSFLTTAYGAEKTNLEPPSTNINGFIVGRKEAAISMVLIDRTGDHYAGIDDTLMHYSGSLVKVAALYAAHDLRAAARKHARDNTFTTPAAFNASFLASIDTSTAVASLLSFPSGQKPVLTSVFTGFKATAPNRVEFVPAYQTALNDIFNNSSAGIVIRGLGYRYINVSLMKGGFFDRNASPPAGIWLAGDYSAEQITKSVRTPVLNDTVAGGSGQAITTKEMARVFRLIHLRQAYPHVADAGDRTDANTGVHQILRAQESFFFDTQAGRLMELAETPGFAQHCAKVGIGSLGKLRPGGGTDGPSVYSEGAVMKWNTMAQITAFNSAKQRSLSGFFALVWQNAYDGPGRWDALVRIINGSIQNFLTQP